MNRELDRDIEAIFGKNFERLSEQDMTEIYNLVRLRMREFYVKSRATKYKICDRCTFTYPRLTDNCKQCHGELREFEVPFDEKFFKVDFLNDGNVTAR